MSRSQTGRPAGSILAISAHARTVRAPERSRLAAQLARRGTPSLVTIVTCHRVEAYGPADEAWLAALADDLPAGAATLRDADAARHLAAVAVGRDSAVLGEDEILHQVRSAFETARTGGPLAPVVSRAFIGALRAGRIARSWQQGRRPSLGDAAVERIAAGPGARGSRPPRILIVGAGTMGALAARAAVAAGATVTIANREPGRAARLAASLGAGTTTFDPGPLAGSVDGVIVAIGGPWRIAPDTIATLVAGRATVVDLSFPPAVVGLAGLPGARIVTADDLALGAPIDADAAPSATVARLDALIDETVEAFVLWTQRDGSRAAAAELVRRADAERSRELDRLWHRLPGTDPDTRAAVEEMTRHLADRLLRPPLERLGRDADERTAAAIRELFAL